MNVFLYGSSIDIFYLLYKKYQHGLDRAMTALLKPTAEANSELFREKFLVAWARTDEIFAIVPTAEVLSGRVDWAAIDSTVLEWLMAERGDLPEEIRVIESLGPSPIPPWVISKKLSASLRGEVRALPLGMHKTRRVRSMLARAGLERFVEAQDHDYDPIRVIARRAEQVSLA
jgi:hypothetical protein